MGSTETQAHWFFSPEERSESSTHLEVRGLLRCLHAFQAECAGSTVFVQVDNHNVGRIQQRGSAGTGLTSLAQDLFRGCEQHSVSMHVRWVPRELNTLADGISKLVDSNDWQLHPRFFGALDTLWGPHSVDAFASSVTPTAVAFTVSSVARVPRVAMHSPNLGTTKFVARFPVRDDWPCRG